MWSTTVIADPVGRDVALFTAKSYLASKGKMVDTAQKPFKARQQAPGNTDDNDDTYYYVFNAGDDNGYVIVSGDDRTEPILGYVEQGSFDAENIPDNMRSWLQLYADQIKYIVDNDIQPTSPKLMARGKATYTKHSVPELLKTRWNQGHPYNLTCPKYYKGDGTQDYPASGCTATAMAQVINFYKFPEKTKALIPIHSNTYTLDNGTKKTVSTKTIPRGTKIDWENMRDTYDCNSSHVHNAQDSAVANLLLICGQSVHMHWGPSSGANFDTNTFTNYLGFDDGCYIGERRDYGIDEWFDMLYKDISEGYPVLFSGFSSGGGHAFVLDGFDGENLFHVNWGWGGGSNGWFLVSILNPGDTSGIGASSSSDGYSMSQRALFNLRLPDNIKAEPTARCTINDVTVNGSIIKGNWVNWTGSDATFNTGIVKLNDDGTYSLVGSPVTATISNNTYQTKSFSVKGKLSEGTHYLSPASKLATAKVWRPQYNMRSEYIEATVDAEGNITLKRKEPEYKIEIDTIVFPGTRIAGAEQEVKVTFRNCGDEYFREIHLLASKTDDMIYTENRSMVAVRKGETVDVSYFFTPTETGTYHLWFSTDNSGRDIVGEGEMEVISEANATKANLSVNSYTISNGSNSAVYGNRLAGKVSIKNNAKTDFDGKLRLQIWRQKKGEGTAWSSTSQTVQVSIAAGKSASVSFEFTDLSTDYNYHLPVYYVGQEGTLTNGGIWNSTFVMEPGVVQWTKAGAISGKAFTLSMSALSSVCGMYAECNKKINRLTPNKNPNTIYAFAAGMELPANLLTAGANWVSGDSAEHIRLVNDNPFYVPAAFEADTATFTYTFPETEDGKHWHAFTMPFEADEIYVDSMPVTLDNENNRFWIYEFSQQDGDGNIVFTPATILRAATPYIIAGGPSMAGKSITFRSIGVPFYPTGSDKMVVTTKQYKFHGTTLCPSVNECYVLNNAGTAFEYVTKATALEGMNAYFTTTLDENERVASIILPDVPEEPTVTGDVNGDGVVTIQDAVSVMEAMASDTFLPSADINGDGAITIQDIVGLLEIMAQN